MIKYFDRNDIDNEKWDDCISRSFNGIIYGYSWFLDIVAEDWGALIDDNYSRVFPLPFKKKLGFNYIYQPFFTQQLGLFSQDLLTEDAVVEFIDAIPRLFNRINLNLNSFNKISKLNAKIISQLNHELDLIHAYDKIYGGYSQNLKRNLKKADKHGLTIVKNIKPDGIIQLFRSNRGKDIDHLKDANYKRLKRLIYTSMYKGKAKVYGVYSERNELIAGACFLVSNNKAIFLFSGLDEEGKEKSAMPFLIDSFIKDHINKHLTFDFDGSNDPNLARFYKSFGSKECVYHNVTINKLDPVSSFLVEVFFSVRKSFRF